MNEQAGLLETFEAMIGRGRTLQVIGVITITAFPLLYSLRFFKSGPAPYDDIWIRAIAVALSIGMVLRYRWPARLRPYYMGFAYLTIIYCLPFFCVFASLQAGGGAIGVANTLLAIFFIVMFLDWKNTMVILLTGAAAATCAYLVLDPTPEWPQDYLGRLPIALLCIVGGVFYKAAERENQRAAIAATYRGLAGSIAHEVRNPLAQIRHHLENIQNALPAPSASEPTRQPLDLEPLYADLAESNLAVSRGLQVIAMTLDQVSDKPLDPAKFSLLLASEATEKALKEFAYDDEQQTARITLKVKIDFYFKGDETAYVFVLFNLLKNALYYMAMNQDARIEVTVDAPHVRFRDTGPGIAPDLLGRIFQPFNTTTKAGGTGLGLAYCARVLQAFGGGITCESELGKFTEFTMSPQVLTQPEADEYVARLLARARELLGHANILVVDDEASQRVATLANLRGLDAHVEEASSGEEALEKLRQTRYDLVILDIKMGGIDGYSVAWRVRQGLAHPNTDVCIVAYSGEPSHVASVKAKRAGMQGFASKPSTQLRLIEEIIRAKAEVAVTVDSALKNVAVLVADDSAWNRRALCGYLAQMGAHTLKATHGTAVMECLASGARVDAVIVDINMPGMTGLEVARAIRSGAVGRRFLPIVAVTAHVSTAHEVEAGAHGIAAVLAKPVDPGLLFKALHKAIAGRRAQTTSAPKDMPSASMRVNFQSSQGLLDIKRLGSYRRMDLLGTLLTECLPALERLGTEVRDAANRGDMDGAIEHLHALLGTSGEAGAQALHREVKGFYVPLVEDRKWPSQQDWHDRIEALTVQSVAALKAFATTDKEAPVAG